MTNRPTFASFKEKALRNPELKAAYDELCRTIAMKPPHPGAFVRIEILEELGLTVTKAAETLDVPRTTLSDLVNEKSPLSPEMASRIEDVFQVNKNLLLRMQAWYDASERREPTDRP